MAIPAVLATIGGALGKAGSWLSNSWLGQNIGNVGTFAGGLSSLGSIFGLGSSGGTSLKNSKRLMDYQELLQEKYTHWLNLNQYKDMRQGLEDADYNPLLALGASPSQGSVGIANATSDSKQDLGAILSSMATIAQIDLLKAQTAKTQDTTVDTVIKNIKKLGNLQNEISKTSFGKKVKEITELATDGMIDKLVEYNTANTPTPFKLNAVKYGNSNSSSSNPKLEVIEPSSASFRSWEKRQRGQRYNRPPATYL